MNPLDQLADISTPQAVSMWPLAWGYWVLIIAFILLLICSLIMWQRYRAHHVNKKLALVAISSIQTDDPYFAHKIQMTVKQFIQHYYPKHNINNLSGAAFQTSMLAIYKERADEKKQDLQIKQTLGQLFLDMYANNAQVQNNENRLTPIAIKETIMHFIKASTPSYWGHKKRQLAQDHNQREEAHV